MYNVYLYSRPRDCFPGVHIETQKTTIEASKYIVLSFLRKYKVREFRFETTKPSYNCDSSWIKLCDSISQNIWGWRGFDGVSV